MDITNRSAVVLFILVTVLATGCTSTSLKSPPPYILTAHVSDEEIAERILKLTPIGTPIEIAKQALVDEGLRCSIELNADTGESWLWCGYSDDRNILVTWTWDIRVQCKDGLVSGATCTFLGTGP